MLLSKKVVLITGVSKGIGRALAEKFKKEGFFTVGLSRSKPVDLELDLFIKADLVKDDKEKIIKELIKSTGKIDVLINNAGVGLYESWEKMSEKDLRYLFELNFFSVVSLTKGFIPYLKETKGTIINVSSVAGKIYVPFMGSYCASKFALNAFSDSLRAELKPYNIHVLNLTVGRINTGFSSRSLGSLKPPETPSLSATPEKLADKVFTAYLKKKREITYPYWYSFFILIAKLFPNLYDSINLKKWKS